MNRADLGLEAIEKEIAQERELHAAEVEKQAQKLHAWRRAIDRRAYHLAGLRESMREEVRQRKQGTPSSLGR